MKFLFPILALNLIVISCEVTTDVHADHDPVLQMDAVFFTGEPLPVIKVRQSFNTSGSSIFEIEEGDILISGAEIEFRHNGAPVSIGEESPGHYRPQASGIVAAGDRFDIVVIHNGRRVSATARVPGYSVEEVQLNPARDVVLSENPPQYPERKWEGTLQVDVNIPFVPVFTALRIYSEMEEEEHRDDFLELNGFRPIDFQAIYGDDHTGKTSLSLPWFVGIYYPLEEGVEKPEGEERVRIYSEIMIPEPIYETWHSTRSEDLVPITITNVDGGVGLFIGAIRVEGEMDVEVILK